MAETDRPRKNHIISRRKIREFLEAHPEHARMKTALMAWFKTALTAEWTSFAAVRATFNTADSVGKYVVFDIGGNKLRLVARILYSVKPRRVYIRDVLTHAEYDGYDFGD